MNKLHLYEGCIFDACALGSAERFICPMLTNYVSQCNALDTSNHIREWRRTGLCDLSSSCGANSEFLSCTAHSCHKSTSSCVVDELECENEIRSACIEGCFCLDGFIFNGSECVLDDGNQCQEEENAAAFDPTAEPTPCIQAGNCDGSAPASLDSIEIENTGSLVSIKLDHLEITNFSADDLLSHGCYCSRLDNSVVLKGKAVSELDQVCRQLSHCDKCKVAEKCGSENGYPFFIVDSTTEIACDAENNSECQQAQCECSVSAAENIVEFVVINDVAIEKFSCVEKQREGQNFDCCGSGNYWMLYKSGTNLECNLDSNDVPFLTEIGSPETIRRTFPGKN